MLVSCNLSQLWVGKLLRYHSRWVFTNLKKRFIIVTWWLYPVDDTSYQGPSWKGSSKTLKKIWYALKMLLYDIYLLFLFRLKCFVSFWWEQVIQFAVNKGIKYYTLYIDVEKWRKRFSFNGLETKSVLKKMRNSDASPLTL